MQTQFKRHQAIKIKRLPNPDQIEWYGEEQKLEKGMKGTINILLPNGKYHVEIKDAHGEALCYAPFDEDDLEAG